MRVRAESPPEAQLFSEELIQAVAAVSTRQDFIQKSQSRLGGRLGTVTFYSHVGNACPQRAWGS